MYWACAPGSGARLTGRSTTGGQPGKSLLILTTFLVIEQSFAAVKGGTVRFYRTDRIGLRDVCHCRESTWTGAVRELDRAPSGGRR